MTRSRIQRLKFFVFLLIFLLAQTAVLCDGNLRERRAAPSTDADARPGTGGRLDDKDGGSSADARKPGRQPDSGNGTRGLVGIISKPDVANRTAHVVDTSSESSEGHTSFNTGALVRGFLVFVGLSIFVMAYIVFRSFRLSKTRAQLVRKYGVLTHRQDVEMRPLPLEEEDDEDTTVFDASNVATINAQHQNA